MLASGALCMIVPLRTTTPAMVTPSARDSACISLTPIDMNPPSRSWAADLPLTMMSSVLWTDSLNTQPVGQVVEGVVTSPGT
jgi:hypothetical protein